MRNRTNRAIFSLHLVFSLLTLLNTALSQKAFSQIHGTVKDAQTGNPLSDVNIFLANTTIGTASGLAGDFIIERAPQGNYDLIFSRIGYEVLVRKIGIIGQKELMLNVRLQPKPIVGEEITIEAKELENWKKDYKKFLKLFVGESQNAGRTQIVNPYVLNFLNDEKSRKFYAFSDSVLIIENHALGYEMQIVFNRFELDRDRLIYGFYSRYLEMKPVDALQKIQWMRQRKEAFRGSFRHFLTALVENRVAEEGFELYQIMSLDRVGASRKIDLKKERLIQPDIREGVFLFRFDLYLGVRYVRKGFPSDDVSESVLSLNAPYAKIDSLGNILNGYAITIRGDWTQRRIPDLLPLDFHFRKNSESKDR